MLNRMLASISLTLLAAMAATPLLAGEVISPAPKTFGFFGYSMTLIEDLSDDSYPELAVGAPREGFGVVYILDGKTRSPRRVLEQPVEDGAGEFGEVLARVGDVNNDGFAELAVGCPNHDGGDGRVFLYDGSSLELLQTIDSPTSATLPITEGGAVNFGRAIVSVGDRTGDGFEEIAIGAPGSEIPGSVLIYDAVKREYIATVTADVIAREFGRALAALPDESGDGIPELIVGAPLDSSNGAVYIFRDPLLRSGEPSRLSDPDAIPTSTLFGFSLATLDMTKDGKADIVIGSPGADPRQDGTAIGSVFVYDVAKGEFLSPAFESLVPEVSGLYGYSLAVVPDVNRDGLADLLIGAPLEGAASRKTSVSGQFGNAYLVVANPPYASRHIESARVQAEGWFGWSVLGIPDLERDGRGDVLIGAPGETSDTIRQGIVYVRLGADIVPVETPTPTPSPSVTPSPTDVPTTSTPTLTASPSPSPTDVPTTATLTPTASPTPFPTATPTFTPSFTASPSPSDVPTTFTTQTPTATIPATPTPLTSEPTGTPTATASPTATDVPTTVTLSPTASPTPFPTATATFTPSFTASPSPSDVPTTVTTQTPTATIPATPTPLFTSFTPTPTETSTATPTTTPSETATPTVTDVPTTVTVTPTVTPSPLPSLTETATPTFTATASVTPSATNTPTATATPSPTETPTVTPTGSPTTVTPSPSPSPTPTRSPVPTLPPCETGAPFTVTPSPTPSPSPTIPPTATPAAAGVIAVSATANEVLITTTGLRSAEGSDAVGVWVQRLNDPGEPLEYLGLITYDALTSPTFTVPWSPEPDSRYEIQARHRNLLRVGSRWTQVAVKGIYTDLGPDVPPVVTAIGTQPKGSDIEISFAGNSTIPGRVGFWIRRHALPETSPEMLQPTDPWQYLGAFPVPIGADVVTMPFTDDGNTYEIASAIARQGGGWVEPYTLNFYPEDVVTYPRLVGTQHLPLEGRALIYFNPVGSATDCQVGVWFREVDEKGGDPLCNWHFLGLYDYDPLKRQMEVPFFPANTQGSFAVAARLRANGVWFSRLIVVQDPLESLGKSTGARPTVIEADFGGDFPTDPFADQ